MLKNKWFIPVILIIALAGLLYFIFASSLKKPFTSGGPVKIETPNVTPKDASLQQGPFTCPSISEFCKLGVDISQNSKYIGIGAKIATGSAIFASIDGDLTSLSSTLTNGEKMTVIYIDNKDSALRATYIFQGTNIIVSRIVTKGEEIGKVGSGLSLYDASLVFSITKNDPINGDKIGLTSKDFK